MNNALWTVRGEPYLSEAKYSQWCLKQVMPDVNCVILGEETSAHPEWYLESTKRLLDKLYQWPDGAKLLWLDSDAFVVEPVYDLFEALDHFDLLMAHAPGHHTAPTRLKVPECFPEYNIGVAAMKNSVKLRQLWELVYVCHQRFFDTYGNYDQAPLRDVLYDNDFGVRLATLPCEYDFRFHFGGQLRDRVKILHGHLPKGFTEQQVAASVNQGYVAGDCIGPRIWTLDKLGCGIT